MADDAALRDALWKMYNEHCTHMRHHETQRSTVAGALIAIATAIIGFITFDKSVGISDVPLALVLMVLGAFGAMFSAKHYERSSLHMERARHYRDELDRLLQGDLIKVLKKKADAKHNSEFAFLHKLRLHKFWIGLYSFLGAVGAVLTVIAIWFPSAIS